MEPLVDQAAQDDLADALGAEDFADLITRFFQQLPELTERIVTAMRAGDAVAVGKAGHTLKGAAINLGFVRLSADAHRIELAGKGGNAQVADLLDILRATAEASRPR
ncbi:MAG: Hpt domain-containing protein [Bacteroidales bacterium]